MKFNISGKTGKRQAIVKLEAGDEVMSSLIGFCRKNRIQSGMLTALGAVDPVTLGWFDPHKCVYVKKIFKKDMELVSLTGNVAWLGPDPIIHAHAVCSDRKFQTVGGHLFAATVSVAVECSIIEFGMKVRRARDPRFTLNLLDL